MMSSRRAAEAPPAVAVPADDEPEPTELNCAVRARRCAAAHEFASVIWFGFPVFHFSSLIIAPV